MNDGRTSPKRRHILSSFNPENLSHPPLRQKRPERRASRSDSPASQQGQPGTNGYKDTGDTREDGDNKSDTTRPRRSRLKLKGDRPSRSRRRRNRSSSHRDRSRDRHSHHDGHGRRRGHRRHRSRSPTPSNPHEPEPLDAEAAFRESLFDAMADDEGAAYWEGVYGQPVHIYEQDKVGPRGELERMTDDEYAAHVRQRMWEKTHAGLLEERARREERRRQREQRARHDKRLHEETERSLRRGEARRESRCWARRWEDYAAAWENWDGSVAAMAWPWAEGAGAPKRAAGWGIVEDGEEEKVKEDEVRAFFVHGLAAEDIGEAAFVAKLKDERVRWHPDKMQQRLGGTVDGKVMRDVTAIFQIIDRLWADMRKNEST